MRLFIGIEFQEHIIEGLYSLQNEIRKKLRSGRFPARNNMHLTLEYLGETSGSRVEEIARALEQVSNDSDPFVLSFSDRLGYFGQRNPVRVVWLGLKGNVTSLLRLQTDIVSAMQGLGFADEARAYSPHVTLVRGAEFLSREILRENGRIAFDVGDFPSIHVNQISLMSSTLEQGNLVYHAVKAFKLSAGASKT